MILNNTRIAAQDYAGMWEQRGREEEMRYSCSVLRAADQGLCDHHSSVLHSGTEESHALVCTAHTTSFTLHGYTPVAHGGYGRVYCVYSA